MIFLFIPFLVSFLFQKKVFASTLLAGDVDADGQVTMADYTIFITRYNTNDPACDFNNSGRVDIADYSLLVANYGLIVSTPTPTATPLPTIVPSPTPTSLPLPPTVTPTPSINYCQQIGGMCCPANKCYLQKLWFDKPAPDQYGTQGGCNPSGLIPFTGRCCRDCSQNAPSG